MRSAEEKAFWWALGQVIETRRRLKGLTQVQLAEKLGVEQSAVSRIERGEYRITAYQLRQLAEMVDSKIFRRVDSLVALLAGSRKRR